MNKVLQSTGMARGETNAIVLDSNMSKGYGRQSSPSHPPLGKGEGVSVTTHKHDTREEKLGIQTRKDDTIQGHAWKARARAGHRRQSIEWVWQHA